MLQSLLGTNGVLAMKIVLGALVNITRSKDCLSGFPPPEDLTLDDVEDISVFSMTMGQFLSATTMQQPSATTTMSITRKRIPMLDELASLSTFKAQTYAIAASLPQQKHEQKIRWARNRTSRHSVQDDQYIDKLSRC